MSVLPFYRSLPDFLWQAARPYRWALLVFLLAPCALVIEAVLIPYSLKLIVDVVSSYQGDRADIYAALAPALWLGGGGWLVMIAIFRLQEWGQCYVHPKLEADIRMRMFDYALGHSHQYFSDHYAGSTANRISDMVLAVRSLWMFVRWPVMATLCVVLAVLAMVAMVNPLFSATLAGWLLVYMTVEYLFSRAADAASLTNAQDRTTLSGKIVDVFSNHALVRYFAAAAHERGYLRGFQSQEIRSNRRLLLTMSNAKIAGEFPTLLMFMLIGWLLVSGWQEGRVSNGDFVFVFYAAFNLLWNVWNVSMQLPEFFKNVGVARQAWEVMQTPHSQTDTPDASPMVVARGEICFEDLAFSYASGRQVFDGLHLRIAAGEKVGLVGFSGAGKTTLTHLLLRLYDVQRGRICIDGVDIAGVTQDSLRQQMAMIPQEPSLFHRSLMDNIRYGRPAATDEEVIEAAKKSHCHEFIVQLPQGYASLVGEHGVKLSGGQRQRIAIARAFLKQAPILVLDEATSSLDSVTERHIQACLGGLMQGRTVLVVAHRLSTLRHMDRIVVFDAGHIIEQGSHEALLAQGGHYATLWQMQAGGFLPDKPDR